MDIYGDEEKDLTAEAILVFARADANAGGNDKGKWTIVDTLMANPRNGVRSNEAWGMLANEYVGPREILGVIDDLDEDGYLDPTGSAKYPTYHITPQGLNALEY